MLSRESVNDKRLIVQLMVDVSVECVVELVDPKSMGADLELIVRRRVEEPV